MKQQRINSFLLNNIENYQVIGISLQSVLFNKRFQSVSAFWRTLSNGTHSIAGVKNRDYFKGISGSYLTLKGKETIEILIIYDASQKIYNQLQVASRVKKLLGVSCKIDFGSYEEYKSKVVEIMEIQQNAQLFGGWYKTKNILKTL